jgi:hypothetical protein
MICGHCKAENTTIAHVRECANILKPEVAAKFPATGVQTQERGTKVNLSLVTHKKPEVEITDGYWTFQEDNVDWVAKVQESLSSGRLYAKRLITDEASNKAVFEYEAGLIFKLQKLNAVPLTLEKAKELGHLYGRCMICGRTLTNEESIEAGIGPVCAGKL